MCTAIGMTLRCFPRRVIAGTTAILRPSQMGIIIVFFFFSLSTEVFYSKFVSVVRFCHPTSMRVVDIFSTSTYDDANPIYHHLVS